MLYYFFGHRRAGSDARQASQNPASAFCLQKDGDVMSLEVVERVSAAEARNKERLVAARAEAKRMVDDAAKRSATILADARNAAMARSKAKMSAAEERAKKRSEEILKKAEADGVELKASAAGKIGKASDLIIGKIKG